MIGKVKNGKVYLANKFEAHDKQKLSKNNNTSLINQLNHVIKCKFVFLGQTIFDCEKVGKVSI